MKTLIINNIASQGYVLSKEFGNSTLLSEDLPIYYRGSVPFIKQSNNSLGYLLQLYNNVFKFDRIIINFPTTWQHYITYRLCKLLKKEVILYFHGSDTRVIGRPKIFQIIFKRYMKDIKRYDDTIWYSTPDLKGYFDLYSVKSKQKPAKIPIEYNNKKKILIFSRNDDFKKTHLYFYRIKRMQKKYDFYFLDWFNNDEYKKKFIKKMPANAFLIKPVNIEHVYFFMNGFDYVWGQNSGKEGVSEQQIKKYFKQK